MPVKELRELGKEELAQRRAELKEEIFHLRLRRATGRLEAPMKLRQNRRELARLETIVRERELKGTEG